MISYLIQTRECLWIHIVVTTRRKFIWHIREFHYNFDVQILDAQNVEIKAVIVHNVDSNDLISTESKNIDVLKKIYTPSVFISESWDNCLNDEFTNENENGATTLQFQNKSSLRMLSNSLSHHSGHLPIFVVTYMTADF